MILFNHNAVWNTTLLNAVCQRVSTRVNEWLTENWKQKKDNSLRAYQLEKLKSKVADIIESVCQSINSIDERGYAGYEFRFKNWNPKSVCLVLDILYYRYPGANEVNKITEYVRLGPEFDYTQVGVTDKIWPVHNYPIDTVDKALKDLDEINAKIDELRKQRSSIKGKVGFKYLDKEQLNISRH